MAFGNQFHMPGACPFEGPGAASTLNANIFRPPVSPTTSSYNLSKSTGSLLSDNSMATGSTTPAPRLGRKRTHDESNYRARGFLSLNTDGGARDLPLEDRAGGEHRYVLAGQIDTPGAQVAPQSLEDSMYSDVDYRRALGPKRPYDEGGRLSLGPVNPETGEPMSPRTAGWTTFAFQAIGGVVGKVWEFCKGGAGAFRGFQAGGGKAFELNGQPIPVLTAQPNTLAAPVDLQESPSSPPFVTPATSGVTHTLDYFPEHRHDDPVKEPQLELDPEPEQKEGQPSPDASPERPAAKRRQTGFGTENDELRRNWVLVEDDEPAATPTKPSPRRATAAASRIPASRSTMASRLHRPGFSTPSGSARKISAPSPRLSTERSSIPTRASSRMSTASSASYAGGFAGSPSAGPREPASYASPRSPTRTTMPNPFSPNTAFPNPATPNSSYTPNGSRIPQPKGLGPNPFANIRTASPTPQGISPSRPATRSSLRPSPSMSNLGFHATPNSHSHRKTASSVSVGSARGRYSFGPDEAYDPQKSPRLDEEARQLASKRFATQKRADSRLDRLNKELQGLIRQGQEALGTTYDVDMEDGWEEDAP